MKTWSAAINGCSGLTGGAYSADTPLALLSGIPTPHPSSLSSLPRLKCGLRRQQRSVNPSCAPMGGHSWTAPGGAEQ